MSVTWEDALDELEARVAAAEAGIELQAGDSVAPFTAPDVEGPLPEALRPRAEAIFERGETLQRRFEDEIERIRAELRKIPNRPRAQGGGHLEYSL